MMLLPKKAYLQLCVRKIFYIFVVILVSIYCDSGILIAQQTTLDGRHRSWVVSDNPHAETLSFELKKEVSAGNLVRINGMNLPSMRQFHINSFSWRMGRKTESIPEIFFDSEGENRQKKRSFRKRSGSLAGKTVGKLPAGTEITVSGMAMGTKASGQLFGFRIETATNRNGPWTAVSDWEIVNLIAAESNSFHVFLRTNGTAVILYVDKFGNPALPGKRNLSVLDSRGNLLATRGVNNESVTTISRDRMPENTDRVLVRDDHGLEAWSNARMSESTDGCKTYFGDLHFHSEFSFDAHRPIQDCLTSAFQELALDFAALGDHFPFHKRGYELHSYFDILDKFNRPDEHVTLLGYELNLTNGHMNLYYRKREEAAKFEKAWNSMWSDPANTGRGGISLDPFFKHFNTNRVIAIPHHTNHTSFPVTEKDGQPSWRNFDLRAMDMRVMPAIEMCQGRGAFESEDLAPDWHVKVGGYGSSLRTALAKGFRIGFVGGSDNHRGWATRLADTPTFCGLTGVQARDLTREAIFDAIKARRTYATTGARIVLDFVLNDKFPMGSEVKLAPTQKRIFKIMVRGTEPLDLIEIISQGATVAKINPKGQRDLDMTWTDPRPDAPQDDCYYYIRIRQTDGHCAWSSPIWIDYASESL